MDDESIVLKYVGSRQKHRTREKTNYNIQTNYTFNGQIKGLVRTTIWKGWKSFAAVDQFYEPVL